MSSPPNLSTPKLRVIFMGTPDFALETFESLADSEDVIAVVTQPDRPKGRKAVLTPTPIKVAALERKLPVFQPERLRRSPELIETLKALAPDLIVVVAFGQILPESVLNIPRYGCINVHASLLPKYRGAGPIQWAIIRGELETGVTTMQMDVGMDTGPILLKKVLPIAADEMTEQLWSRLASAGAMLLLETLADLKAGRLKAIPQNNAEATMAPLIKKTEGLLDWSLSATEIFNRWRGLSPWPGLTTYYENKRWKLTKMKLEDAHGDYGKPGTLLSLSSAGLSVATGCGTILIPQLQAEGKRAMTPLDYVSGNEIALGAVLHADSQ